MGSTPRVDRSILQRPRLYRALDNDVTVTVLHGPAGAGKSTVIDQWERTTETVVARVPAPERGRRPAAFWLAVDTALGVAGVPDGDGPGLGGDAEIGPADIARRLRAPDCPDVTLVLAHPDRVDDPCMEQQLAALAVDHVRLRLIVELRSPGWFAGADMVGERRLVGPRALAMTQGETAELFVQVQPGLASRPELLGWLHAEVGGNPLLARAVTPVLWQFEQSTGPGDDAVAREALISAVEDTMLASAAADPELDTFIDAAVAAAITGRIGGPVFDQIAGVHAQRAGEQLAILARADDARTLAPVARRAGTDMVRRSQAASVAAVAGRVLRLLEGGDDVPVLLRAAVALGDWQRVRDVLITRWPHVAVADPELLRTAILALPEAVVAPDGRAQAMRAMYSGLGRQDWREPVGIRRVGTALAGAHGEPLETIDALGRGTLAMIMARTDGRWAEATAWADALDGVWDATTEEERAELGGAAYLLSCQWGLTRLCAGDSEGAERLLTRSYNGGVAVGAAAVATTAAGALALLAAMAADIEQACRWSEAERRAADSVAGGRGAVDPAARHPGLLASVLTAVARMDPEALAAAETRAQVATTLPEMWWVHEYGRAHAQLLAGRSEAGIDRLRRVRQRRGGRPEPDVAATRMLDRAQVRLSIAAGRGDEALVLLGDQGDGGDDTVCRARVALLAGDPPRAEMLARQVLSESAVPAVQVQAGLLVAAAAVRSGRIAEAAVEVDRLWEAAAAEGLERSTLTMSRADRAVLLDEAELDPQLRALWTAESDVEIYPDAMALIALTPREREMLILLGAGLTPAGVADRLEISRNTVKSQLRTAYRKLGAGSAGEAVSEAHRLGLF